ncbi:MAG: divalent-cation tolerance protein CutA [Moorea sp. SIO3C2]|nr:divalent-cation tolerance protein CutA [Moorena sp. SIO3C2]
MTLQPKYKGKIVEEPETVLIIKTQSGYRDEIEQVIGKLPIQI